MKNCLPKSIIFEPNSSKMTVKIELLREDAMSLLRYLERLHVLKVILPEPQEAPKKPANKSRFSGRISVAAANELHEQLNEMREEWR